MTDNQPLPPVIQYLLGQGPLDGCYYPDFPDNGEKYKSRYWWRKALLEAFETRAASPSIPEGWQHEIKAVASEGYMRGVNIALDKVYNFALEHEQDAVIMYIRVVRDQLAALPHPPEQTK